LERALTREEARAVLGRNGNADAAAALLHKALDTYERLDADRDAARTRATCGSSASTAAGRARASVP